MKGAVVAQLALLNVQPTGLEGQERKEKSAQIAKWVVEAINAAHMKDNAMIDRAAIIEVNELVLLWKGRAAAFRMVDSQRTVSCIETLEAAKTFDECAGELTRALAAVPPSPPSKPLLDQRGVEAINGLPEGALTEAYAVIERGEFTELPPLGDSKRGPAPPSIPEREKLLEAISRAHYQFDRHTPCMSRGHAEAILSAIAALEGK